jgi:cyclophilin family peptidyl-prolyl cis-trans isomerase
MHSTNTHQSRSRASGRSSLTKSWALLFCFALIAGSHALFGQSGSNNPIARFHTDLGDIDVVLLQDVAPNTVANFLGYVNSAAYDNSFIHRSVPSFIIQGGGYDFINGQVVAIPANAPVVNEFHISNKRGTVAMAKIAGDPNSATNQWFFNESDSNASNLDTQNGGFTVFGRIITSTGLTTMDTIATVPIYNAGTGFESLPLRNYTSGNVQNANLVHVIWIKVVPQISALTHPSANTVHVQGRGTANSTYQLQMSASPAGNTFTTSVNVTADSTGNISYNDANAGTKKFYRLAIP